jgi:hypothetical protein
MTAKTTSRTAKSSAAKPAVMLADPDATPTAAPIETPIVATSNVLSNGINPEDVNLCKTLTESLKTHRKADKEICRSLGILWNTMSAAWKGEGACALWIGTQFGFAERTVYLYRKLADKWTAAEADWKEHHPNLSVELATVNEFLGSFDRKWSPDEPKTPAVKPTTKPTPTVTPTEAKDKATAPNGATTTPPATPTTTKPEQEDDTFRPLTNFEVFFRCTSEQLDQAFMGLMMIKSGLANLDVTGSEKIKHAMRHIADAAIAIEGELHRLKTEPHK